MASRANNLPQNMQNAHMQPQEQRLPPATSIKVPEPVIQFEATVTGQFFRRLFQIIFYVQLGLIFILVITLTIRGLLFAANHHHFRPREWYPPLLVSIACAGFVSLTWQWITFIKPSKAIKAAFWISPLLTCGVGVLHVLIGSAGSLAVGSIALVIALIQSLYSCWVTPRFEYAAKILSVSTAFPPAQTTGFVFLWVAATVVYCSFMVMGIGGATATRTGIDILFITVIVLSLAWTLQVIKNMLYVTISRVRYLNFACGDDMDTEVALRDTFRHLTGSVCIGSGLVPVISVIRGSSRAINLFARDSDEFLFSCADCYSGVASCLIRCGNRWGFVHVGVYNKGFVQASSDTWEMFKRAGMVELIDSDLTGAFCFLCGVAGGSICSLVAGTWTLIIHKSYASAVSIYAFLMGYFMCRIAMAWQQACVSAYYVAYAENPDSQRFDATIPARLEELQRYRE
ncbi:hypothetical protein SLA2020_253600 [Shorea laevis]